MQIIAPTLTVLSVVVNISQQSALSQITKAYVALMFVVNIDDMFVGSLPAEIKENANILNDQKALVLEKDFNTFSLIFGRMKNIIALRLNPCKNKD